MAIFIYEVIYVLLIEVIIYKHYTNTTDYYDLDVKFLESLALCWMSIFQILIIISLIPN